MDKNSIMEFFEISEEFCASHHDCEFCPAHNDENPFVCEVFLRPTIPPHWNKSTMKDIENYVDEIIKWHKEKEDNS